MNGTWIKSYRRKIMWRWYRHPATAHLFDYLLHVAEFIDCKKFGIELKAGQVLTTYRKMSEETGLSLMQVRRAIENLTNRKNGCVGNTELDIQATREFSIITIKNWASYQAPDTATDTLTDTQGNTPTDTLYKNKEIRIKKNIVSTKVDTSQNTVLGSEPVKIPYQEFAQLYNTNCPRLSKAKELSDGRKQKIKARFMKKPDLDFWKQVFEKANASDFCAGGGWCNLDWLITNDTNYLKVFEGKYDNKAPKSITEGLRFD